MDVRSFTTLLPLAPAGAAVLLLALWFLLSGLSHAWYRHVFLYRIACLAGAAWRLLTTGCGGALSLLALVAIIFWLRCRILGIPNLLQVFLSFGMLLEVVAASAILALLYMAYQSRRRIFIQEFKDFASSPIITIAGQGQAGQTGSKPADSGKKDSKPDDSGKKAEGSDALKPFISGMHLLLQGELARMTRLYAAIDSIGRLRPEGIGDGDGASGGACGASVNVDEVGQLLKGAFNADSKLSLGPLQVPVGAVMGVIGLSVQGPRLSGSVHRDGRRLILIAQVEGRTGKKGKSGNSWRLTSDDVAGGGAGPDVERLQQMVEQMACRIFSDLGEKDGRNWRAVSAYVDGLCSYLDTRNTMKERKPNLRRAEKAFIRALAEDNTFARCYYNLGIVYRDLGEQSSSEKALLRAVEEDSRMQDAYYALGVHYWQKGEYEKVVSFSEQAISIDKRDARAWALKGLVQRKLKMPPAKYIRTRSIAAGKAWRELIVSAFKGRTGKREIAARCTRDLAIALYYGKGALLIKRIKQIFAQAIYLDQINDDLYFELGKILLGLNDLEGASASLSKALQIQDKPVYHAYMASVHAKKGQCVDEAVKACRQALRCPSDADEDTLNTIRDVYHAIGYEKEAARVRMISKINKIDEQAISATDYSGAMQELIAMLGETGGSDAALADIRNWNWARGRIRLILGSQALASGKESGKVPVYFHRAVKLLEQDYPGEIESHCVYGSLARAYLAKEDMRKAILYAVKAVALSPINPEARACLGEVYCACKDYDKAADEFEKYFDLEPSSCESFFKIVNNYRNLGVDLIDPALRKQAFVKVIDYLNRALALVESEPMDENNEGCLLDSYGYAHYWLGRFHCDLEQYYDAVLHLNLSREIGFMRLESEVALGWTYLQAKYYEKAEDACKEALQGLWQELQQGKGGDAIPDAHGELAINEMMAESLLNLADAYLQDGKKNYARVCAGRAALIYIPSVKQDKRRSYLKQYNHILAQLPGYARRSRA